MTGSPYCDGLTGDTPMNSTWPRLTSWPLIILALSYAGATSWAELPQGEPVGKPECVRKIDLQDFPEQNSLRKHSLLGGSHK